ncbi:hypothetical protein AN217_13000 [Streptomyces qinglanensis]|uniref:Uncharacterized protein n=1 Tax=Streptomyces qinglanensis TaxID=943816 RepID=A0A1E7K3S6_9ACTN|nr:hypothetical protein AN217_13000 [Streptomyces qinglanensis]OEV26801.1 hypothetical protein AN220_07340 [Streptomyces nanshensis]
MSDQRGVGACFERGAVGGELGVAVGDLLLSGVGAAGLSWIFLGGGSHEIDGLVQAVGREDLREPVVEQPDQPRFP